MPEIANVEQAKAWDGPSGAAWVEREQFQNAALAPITDCLFAAAAVQSSEQVLDVGCGTGDTTRRAARLAVEGAVLGVDLSSAMLARARERSTEEGITNATYLQGDAQVEPFVDASFDVVLSRFGMMFFADPAAAFANLRRATRPGGRLAVVVFQTFAENEWVREPYAALSLGRDIATPADDVAGPFGLASPDRLRTILGDAGWASIDLDDQLVPYDFGADPATAARHAGEIGVLNGLLDGLDGADRARAMAALTDVMTAHVSPQGVRLDARVWIVRATREDSAR